MLLRNSLLTVLFLLVPVLSLENPAFNDDVLGLIVFKAGLQDPQSKLASWNEEDDNPCNWVGVKCDPSTNRVTDLTLNGFSLSGHIGKSLVRLQFLKTLSLSNNNFTGSINPVISQIPSIRVVDLSQNGLSGSIPEELFQFQQCGSLRVVSLAKNMLSGRIPDSITSCGVLEGVDFSANQLSGSLPTKIWSLTALRSLDLSNNLLSGEIPTGIESLFDLRVVNFSHNQFSGKLPEKIGECLLLKTVDFSDNFLSGEIPLSMQKLSLCNAVNLRGNSLSGKLPDWIGDMRSLELLDVSANNLSGQVPNSMGDLALLKELNLSSNQFSGSLPDSLANCANLLVMDISQNSLSGNLPLWAFRLGLKGLSVSRNQFSGIVEFPSLTTMAACYDSLEVLDLSSNALSGVIPLAIGNFSSLLFLNLSRNSLIGSVPESVGGLKAVYAMDLSHNRINGSIPSEIGGSISLREIRLEDNLLTGTIPSQIEKCSALTTLILSRNNISGSIPIEITNLTHLQIVDLSYNHLTGNLPKELTNLSDLVVFNISHNQLEGELPVGGFFNTIPLSSVSDNPSLCGSVVKHSCPAVHPKPIVLNPNSSDSNHGTLSSNLGHKRIILSISTLIAIGAAVFIALGVITVTVLNLHVRSSMSRFPPPDDPTFSGGDEYSRSHSPDSTYGKLVMFENNNAAEFVSGTHALLNKDCELGRGGFGVVYWTALRDGRSVAIKKLHASSMMKSQEDFGKELQKLGKMRHNNLVSLEGYYWTPSLQLLITEYVPSGSLYKHLHEGNSNNCLSWRERFEIILGSAKGLAYLHKANVIHYNIKSSNVLIDSSGEAKVGDFGLARLLPSLDRHVLSGKIQSALGYMAPEFACLTVKITEKCDVYGFGILILEVVTGKRPVEYMEDDVVILCDMVRGLLEAGKTEECIDGKLNGIFPVEEAVPVIKLGLVCASQVPSNRPDMDEVVKILELIQCPSEGQEELLE